MKSVKFISLILSLIICLSVVGCGKEPTKAVVKGNTLIEVSPDNEKAFSYTVVRAKGCSDEIDDSAKALRKMLKKTFDLRVTLTYDEAVKDYDGNYEILIGETDRVESAEAKKILEKNRKSCDLDFIIKVIGEKICIYSPNELMLNKALVYFTEQYCGSKEAWRKLTNKTEKIYEAPLEYFEHKISGESLRDFVIVTPIDMEYIYGMEIDNLVNYLYSFQGYELPVKDERHETAETKILVGELSCEESKAVTADKNSYAIKVIGKKLVIKGDTSLTTGAGVAKFLSMIKESEASGKALDLKDGFELKEAYTKPENGYSYVWGDEFNTGKDINHYWWVDYGQQDNYYGKISDSCLGGTITNRNTGLVSIKDGCAVLASKRNGKDFESSEMSTYDTMIYKYGILEIRATLPITPANCAFWLNGADLPGGGMTEYDILENFGSETEFAANIHKWADNNYHTSLDGAEFGKDKAVEFKDELDSDMTLSNSFHTYSMLWDDRSVKFALDGKVFFEYDIDERDAVDIHRFATYLIIANSMGNTGYGINATDDGPTYTELKVDYVRLYQRDDIASELQTPENMDDYNYNNRTYKREYH